MKLVGINGFRRSGKDTTYHRVAALAQGENVRRAAFADKLKIMAALSIGYTGTNEELIGAMDRLKETGRVESYLGDTHHSIDGRRYLQNFGQHARHVFGDSFWVDQVLPVPTASGLKSVPKSDEDYWQPVTEANMRQVQMRYPGVDWLCVTDVRYPNEAERVLLLGGEVWEVIKPGLESDGHSSEQPLPRELVTVQIWNKGTIDDLEKLVQIAMDRHGQPKLFAEVI
jgi:hypothetical protein